MTETVLMQTPLKVTFVIRRDTVSGRFYGYLRQYPGIISEGTTPASVRRQLIALLREVSRTHPEELSLFR